MGELAPWFFALIDKLIPDRGAKAVEQPPPPPSLVIGTKSLVHLEHSVQSNAPPFLS